MIESRIYLLCIEFLTDMERSHKVAEWVYAQGKENNYVQWKI